MKFYLTTSVSPPKHVILICLIFASLLLGFNHSEPLLTAAMVGVEGMPHDVSVMLRITVIMLGLLCPVALCDGGVFGCGGFVKSDVDINFSLVEVSFGFQGIF